MTTPTRREVLALSLVPLPALLSACGGGGGGGTTPTTPPPPPPPPPPSPPPGPAAVPAWAGYAGNAQHQALSTVASQPLTRVMWTTPVDLVPPYRAGGFLLIHYGSPAISAANTLLVPVKTAATGLFRVEARSGTDGSLMWQQTTSYVLPTSSWTPSYNVALDHNSRLYMPESGGRLLARDTVDQANGAVKRVAFYGDAAYAANAAALDAAIIINTPLTVDDAGNVFFGFLAADGNPAGLKSGFARVAADGSGLWLGAAQLAGDVAITQPAMNAAPALSLDQRTLYVAVNTSPTNTLQTGYLLALDSATLALKAKRVLVDPRSAQPARISDSSTASPSIGPDGDVYYGVLDGTREDHNGRGWLLHFDATLATSKLPGSFGWDDTPAVVPAGMVGGYTGTSTYLLLVKYNNYYGVGTGNGRNEMAVLDPNDSQVDRFSPAAVTVMREVLTIVGPTPDADTPGGVREWCVNTAVVDPQTASVLVNNEDGVLYRWDLRSNRFTESVRLNTGVGQAYTPTLIGPNGVVYSINAATLNAVGR